MNEVIITINDSDFDKVIENKTIYEIEVISYQGLIKTKKVLFAYKYILIFIILSMLIIYFLSNLIFRVDIVTNDNVMRQKISKYHLKKSYSDLQEIKKDILNDYKEEIDWIEIESIGSKYIVRFEPRIKTDLTKDNKFQNIIAKKNAIIYSMDIKNGQIIKNRFDYVKKGDVIVSGYIYLNDKIMNTIKAEGDVYGETWYKIKVKYPYKYKSIKKTGKSKKVLSIKFLNNDINLFNFNKYKDYKKTNKVLFKNNILPISIDMEKQEELDIQKENNSYKEAVDEAVKSALKKLKKKIDDKAYINDYKVLNVNKLNDGVSVDVFISVIEIISEYQEIEEYKEIDSEQP